MSGYIDPFQPTSLSAILICEVIASILITLYMVLGYIGGAICAFRAALMRLRQLTSPVIKIVSRMINATVCTLCGFLLL